MQTTSMRGSVTRRSAKMNAQCVSACSAPRARGAVAPAARKALSSSPSSAAASSSARVVSASAVAAAPAAATTSGARSAAKTDVPKEQQKPTAVITGASSGLGLAAAVALAKKGDWHVIMAVRDFSKAEAAARAAGLPRDSYSIVHLDLASLDSVRAFVDALRNSNRRLDALVANAAVYLPTAKEPRFTADGFELSVGTNHLGHFLLCRLLLDDLQNAPKANRASAKPRMVIVGSITGNTNTLAGNVPPKADLGDLRGLAAGIGPGTTAMMDGGEFDGAKAYKDSKVCNMLTMRELHRRYNDSTGVTFASLYPGCIAETGLFREHYPVFRTLFPAFQKYVTKGYVSEAEAGRRLAQVIADPSAEFDKSGVYWSWSNESGSFENEVSDEVADGEKGQKLWDLSEKLVGLA